MFRLFESIFGTERHDDSSIYPKELIERAIERTVDGTDARLRALTGYRKKLRPAVIHAIDRVVALVDELAMPLELRGADYSSDPEIHAYFISRQHLQETLAGDQNLNQWLQSAEGRADHITALLLMQQRERRVLGPALEGDQLRHDVAQTTVSFTAHRFVDPTGSEDETRRLLKRRAFDHLLTLALERITTAQAARRNLEQERNLLRRKHAALAKGQWGFDAASGKAAPDLPAVVKQLTEIESQLAAHGAGAALLNVHLGIVVDVLTGAERGLWLEPRPLIVDRMGVKQSKASARAPEISLPVLHNAAGRELVSRLVGVVRAEIPPRRDFLREARRYLG